MVRGQEQLPTLALALDDFTRSALQAAAKAIEACPEELLGAVGATFEPESHENFQMAVVMCTDRLCKLPSQDLQTLYDDIRRHIAATVSLETQSLQCRGLELFGPDRSHLIARFRAPEQLTQLRRAIWRTCKDFGTAFPDAMWAPHIRIGRIKASRGQLNKLVFSKVPDQLSELVIRPQALTLLGKRPQDSYCDCNWEIPLATLATEAKRPQANREMLIAPCVVAALGTRGASAPAGVERNATLEEETSQADNSCERAATAPVVGPRTEGFVAELPKFRRPAGMIRPVRKGSVAIAPP